MKLRLICKESNSAHVVYGGASQATEEYKTFEMECPSEIAEWLSLVEEKGLSISLDGL